MWDGLGMVTTLQQLKHFARRCQRCSGPTKVTKVVSNTFYFHPEPWGNDLFWLIFFKWVGWNHQLVIIMNHYSVAHLKHLTMLPSYRGIIINHNFWIPFLTTRIQWKASEFFFSGSVGLLTDRLAPGPVGWSVHQIGWNHPWNSETTPRKINMEHNHGGLEDHFPFQMGDL